MLESWQEASGWIAAVVSCLSFGSFAVPIKSNECRRVDCDPLVFQSYKTAMCLLTSWIVIPMGQPVYFTPWGIISGLFWVPAGVAAIYAVKNAGLAISQGLWSSIIVMVSFTWGIFIFHEQVKSIAGALIAVGLMIVGLWGMSFYSSPAFSNYEQVHSISSLVDIVPPVDAVDSSIRGKGGTQYQDETEESFSAAYSNTTNHISLSPTRTTSRSYDQENYEVVHSISGETKKKFDDDLSLEGDEMNHGNDDDDDGISYTSSVTGENEKDLESNQSNYHNLSKRKKFVPAYDNTSSSNSNNNNHENLGTEEEDDDHDDYFVGNPSNERLERQQQSRRAMILSQRTLGLMSAVFNGVWGGSIMVPMHYAPEDAHGIGYVISFAIGATTITICLWIARFGYHYFFEGMTLRGSYHSLPSFHFDVMWKPGGTAGLLWSIGNLSSMISVQQLGEGVGYSLTQASMLVSGIWGIFYFREVEGFVIRAKWFLSAMITIAGILMLSFEHVNDGSNSSDSVR